MSYLARVSYTGNRSTTGYAVPFSYISTTHIKAYFSFLFIVCIISLIGVISEFERSWVEKIEKSVQLNVTLMPQNTQLRKENKL